MNWLKKFRWITILIVTGSNLLYLAPASIAQPQWDVQGLRRINQNHSPSVDDVVHYWETTATPMMAMPIGLYLWGAKTNDAKLKDAALLTASAEFITLSAVYLLKYIVNRQRPFRELNGIRKLGDTKSPSFPSAHAAGAFALATSLTLEYPKTWIRVTALLWATGIAYGRIYQGMHYPSDVLVGTFVGASTAWILHHYKKSWLNFLQHHLSLQITWTQNEQRLIFLQQLPLF